MTGPFDHFLGDVLLRVALASRSINTQTNARSPKTALHMMTPRCVNRMNGKSNKYQIWKRTTSHVHIYMSRATSKTKEGVMTCMFVKHSCGFTLGHGFSGKSLGISRNSQQTPWTTISTGLPTHAGSQRWLPTANIC